MGRCLRSNRAARRWRFGPPGRESVGAPIPPSMGVELGDLYYRARTNGEFFNFIGRLSVESPNLLNMIPVPR